MEYAFIIPLTCSTIYFILYKLDIKINVSFNNLFKSSIITFTFYSIVRGVLEIYGTTNSLINIYLIVGIILFVMSLCIKCKFKVQK